MKPSLYVETTIASFVVGGISPVLVIVAHQAATRQWWEERWQEYRLFISTLVEEELSEGDPTYATQRLALVADVPQLVITAEVSQLADYFFAHLHLPQSAGPDAMHLAVASHNAVDYLLTLNLKHLANARVRWTLQRLHNDAGVFIPTICTPEELLGSEDEIW